MKKFLSVLFLILALLFLEGSVFFRLSDCYWRRQSEQEQPWTEEQLIQMGIIKVCPTPMPYSGTYNPGGLPQIENLPQSMPFIPAGATPSSQIISPTPSNQLPASKAAEMRRNIELRTACEQDHEKTLLNYQSTHPPVVNVTYTTATQNELTTCLKNYSTTLIQLPWLYISMLFSVHK